MSMYIRQLLASIVIFMALPDARVKSIEGAISDSFHPDPNRSYAWYKNRGIGISLAIWIWQDAEKVLEIFVPLTSERGQESVTFRIGDDGVEANLYTGKYLEGFVGNPNPVMPVRPPPMENIDGRGYTEPPYTPPYLKKTAVVGVFTLKNITCSSSLLNDVQVEILDLKLEFDGETQIHIQNATFTIIVMPA